MASGGSSSYAPLLYKAAAIGAAATLAAGAGYVIYKYVLTPDLVPEQPDISMQELLTGGAARTSGSAPARTANAGVPVRKTPSPPRSRGGPSLPTRKSPATAKAAAPRSPTTPPADSAPPDGSEAGPSTSAAPASTTASSAAAPAVKPSTAGLKACACCAQPLKALPPRCGQCKCVYYCTVACQKQHWPEHKLTCAKAFGGQGAAASSGGSPPEAPASPTLPPASAGAADHEESATAAAAPAAALAAEPAEEAVTADSKASGSEEGEEKGGMAEQSEAEAKPSKEEGTDEASASSSGAGGSGSHGGGLQGALVEVLRQAAEKGAGTLDGAFEEAVMHFLAGQLTTALRSFESLQTSARAKGRRDLVLELHKWLGHTNTKLGNFAAAAGSFQAGIEAARDAGNTMAQVDNAVGLGNLWKLAGRLTEAAEVLKAALVVAQEANSAGMQSEVLVALGNVVMTVDPEEGLQCLQIAVKLREDEVAKAAETGDRAAMATGMMQAASAMVNMGAALFATRRFERSQEAYVQAMDIFELMEDHDKVVQVLVNLANLAELQLNQPEEALEYRNKLASLLRESGHPGLAGGSPEPPCGVCKEPVALYKARARSDRRGAMVLLGCLHVQHDDCFKDWSERAQIAPAALAVGLAAENGGEAAAALAATAASPGARRTSVCPTCRAPVPVMS